MSTREDIPVVEAEPVDSTAEDAEEKVDETINDHESGEDSGDVFGQFVYSFGHGFVQAPIDGVREIVNTLTGTKIVPKVEVVKPPEKKEIATPEWQAQKVGAGCGLVASIVVISSLLSKGRII